MRQIKVIYTLVAGQFVFALYPQGKNKLTHLPNRHMEGIGRGRLFIGAMHGSAPTGASYAEPQPGMGLDSATITNGLWQ